MAYVPSTLPRGSGERENAIFQAISATVGSSCRPGERQEVTPEILAGQRLGHQVSGCAARAPMPRGGCATSWPPPFRPGGRNPWRMRLRTVLLVSARSKKASMTSSRRSWQHCSRLKVLCRALVRHALGAGVVPALSSRVVMTCRLAESARTDCRGLRCRLLRRGHGTGQFLTADPDSSDRNEQGEQPNPAATRNAREKPTVRA